MANTTDNVILTLAEAAALLRMNKEVLRRRMRQGDIPGGRKVGADWKFNRQALLDWVAAGHQGEES